MNKRFEALDAFRGLCAISVVIFHMRIIDSIADLHFFRNSYIFVEFFFVLSGFVLTHAYANRKTSFKSFFKSRFYRLFPLHIFMLLVFFIFELGKLAAYKFAGFTFNNLPFTGSSSLSEFIPNLILIHAWTPLTDHLSFNYPSWSISIEFYLYFIFYFTIISFKNSKFIVWAGISLLAMYLSYSDSDFLVRAVLRGLSCFFGGAVSYVIFNKICGLNINKKTGTIAEFLVIAAVVAITSSEHHDNPVLITILFAISVITFSFESGLISTLLKLSFFQLLGKLSYSIYMTHAAILFFLTSIAMVLQKISGMNLTIMVDGTRYLNFGNNLLNNSIIVLIVTLVVLVSLLTYKFIEIPGQKLNKK